ncbi:MAG: class I SAM-dependent DNA methyltransferase, partial [Euryarchaeota archaeon]|nr:class I SAM-dependent DNA methyltransferase [Euryarchaeota archaeon]
MQKKLGKLTLDKFESHLWESANILRGSIDSSDYKNYIFGMLFLKRLSDVFEEKQNEIRKNHGKQFIEDRDFHEFYVPPRARWKNIKEKTQDIGEELNKAFEVLEEENSLLEGVLVSIDYNDKERLPDNVLEELIQHFSTYKLGNKDLEDPDMLGRAYEYLIRQFADDAGKKGGEFYTPRQVVRLLIEILNPEPKMRVYDPCCGSGGMLVYSAKHLEERGHSASEISLYGQERNLNTWAICKMNMLLHGLYDAKIDKGDTMRNPKFVKEGTLQQFDIVVANPMWNQSSWGKKFLKNAEPYGRFSYGLPPKNSADWAWIQHMLASTNKKGKIGVVLDNGVLFRSRSEGKIRKKVIEEDLIEAVIALPSNLFYNTSSPGCILILNKDKPTERKDRIIFVYAEEDYREGSAQNFLEDEHIKKIMDAIE